jgi:hypothetical protein
MRKYNDLVGSLLADLSRGNLESLTGTPTENLGLPKLLKELIIGRFHLWSLNDIIDDMVDASVDARA